MRVRQTEDARLAIILRLHRQHAVQQQPVAAAIALGLAMRAASPASVPSQPVGLRMIGKVQPGRVLNQQRHIARIARRPCRQPMRLTE